MRTATDSVTHGCASLIDRYGRVTCTRPGSAIAERKYGRRSQFAPCASASGEARLGERAVGAQHDVAARLAAVRVEQEAARGRVEREEVPAHLVERLAGRETLGRTFERAQVRREPLRIAPFTRVGLLPEAFGQLADAARRGRAVRQPRRRPAEVIALHEIGLARQRDLRLVLGLDALDEHQLAGLVQQRHGPVQDRGGPVRCAACDSMIRSSFTMSGFSCQIRSRFE